MCADQPAWSGSIFGIWSGTENRILCNAGTVLPDAVDVISCWTEHWSWQRKTCQTGNGMRHVRGRSSGNSGCPICIIFRGSLPAAIFTSDEPVIGRAAEYLRGFAPEAVLTSFLFSYMGYFNGKGKTLFVMAQGLAQTFLVRIPMSYFMSIQPDASLTKIGLAAPTATVFGIILCSIYFVVLGRKEKI